MSTSNRPEVSIDYSGVKEGRVAIVLAIETHKVDAAACIFEFSQYPAEREFLVLPLSYLECLQDRDEIVNTKHGIVRMVHVRVNTNGKADCGRAGVQAQEHVRRDVA